MVSPSSLIFVAVIAIWAAYLVVDTTRRREHLATARSVDRFSAQMRVLQRRAVRREGAEAFEASSGPVRATSSMILRARPAEVSAVTASPVSTAEPGSGATSAARRSGPSRPVRRAVAILALLAAITTLVTAVLAALGIVHIAAPAMGLLVGTGSLVWLRRQALADRAAVRRAEGSRRRQADRERRQEEAARIQARPSAAAMPVAQEHVVPHMVDDEDRAGIELESAPTDEAAVVAATADPLQGTPGWEPVPVPPPTYTLKARADHPVPPPLPVPQSPVPLPDEWDDVAWDAPWSRAVGD